MKRIILGDIHGRGEIAIDIYNKETPDSVIFLGDYFDSHDDITTEAQVDSFNMILELRSIHKMRGKGDFVMLIGNHDFHYIMDDPQIRYSQWSRETFNVAHDILNNCIKSGILSVIHVDNQNNTIYSHAGVSKYWFNEIFQGSSLNDINFDMDLNDLRFNMFMGWEYSGNTISQSPIWIRPLALFSNLYSKDGVVWTQIVGHTPTVVPIENGHPYGEEIGEYNKPIWIIEGLKYYIVEEIDGDGNVIRREIKKYGK